MTFLLTLLALQAADEREKWLPPVRTVTLERADRTVKEVLDAVRAQTGLEVELFGGEEAARVAFEAKERPVLEALDGLCRALGKGTLKVVDSPKGPAGSIQVHAGDPAPPAASHWRQFRVEVEDVHVTVQRSLQEVKRSARLALRLEAQPGTRPLAVGEFIAEEAVDDAGWSLLAAGERYSRSGDEGAEGEDPDAVLFEERFGRSGMDRSLSVALSVPAKEARRIERLRGRIPVSFPLRWVEESIPAAELAGGRDIRIGSMTVKVASFKQAADKATLVYQVGGRARGSGRDYPSFPSFELRDEKGEAIGRGHSGSGSNEGYTMEYRLARPVPVASIRYAAYLGRVTVMVPVELRNIPLPEAKRP